MTKIYLIVGLGNPGARYEKTRHNVGYMCVDKLAARHGLTFAKTEHKAVTASGKIGDKKVILAKPLTFMNLSGDSVVPLANFYKIDPAEILVACDDMDIAFGTLRIRKSGSSGGQNGLKHIIERIGTQAINRIRIGIGRPPGRMNPADYVLTNFKSDEEIDAAILIERAADAAESWLKSGIEIAMNKHNGTGDEPAKPAKPEAKPANDLRTSDVMPVPEKE